MAPDNLDNRLVLSHEYGERSFPHEEWRWLRSNEPVHMTDAENVSARQGIEDAIGLEDYYLIEEETVEEKKSPQIRRRTASNNLRKDSNLQ